MGHPNVYVLRFIYIVVYLIYTHIDLFISVYNNHVIEIYHLDILTQKFDSITILVLRNIKKNCNKTNHIEHNINIYFG